MLPRYSFPPLRLIGAGLSFLLGLKRSFRQDGIASIRRLQPPLVLLGQENIPSSGPCLLLYNHYYRPGFNAWWQALSIAAVVPAEVHFTMAGVLTYPGKWYAPLGEAAWSWLLRRVARTYGFTTMPPMPPRPQDVEARAASVRQLLTFARDHPQAILALAPEGGDQPGGVLSLPAPGSGRFISLLAKNHLPIVPVGIYEENGCLVLSFGKAFRLQEQPGLPAEERDRSAAVQVMQAIAGQLPAGLRGGFDRPAPATRME